MHEDDAPLPSKPVHCRVCTILIGKGFEERRPIPLTNGRGYICWQCYASVRRQTARRSAERAQHGQSAHGQSAHGPSARSSSAHSSPSR